MLTPGRYVGALGVEDDGIAIEERFAALKARLRDELREGRMLDAEIERVLGAVVVDA